MSAHFSHFIRIEFVRWLYFVYNQYIRIKIVLNVY